MRKQIGCIAGVLASALLLVFCFQIDARPTVGEQVPDSVASSLRGGVCDMRSKQKCEGGVKKDDFGNDCTTKDVYAIDPFVTQNTENTMIIYCGGTNKFCTLYYKKQDPGCNSK